MCTVACAWILVRREGAPDHRSQVRLVSDRGERLRADASQIDGLINRIVYFPDESAVGETV